MPEHPIEAHCDVSQLLMEGHAGVLSVRVKRTAAGGPAMQIEAKVESETDLVPTGRPHSFSLPDGGSRTLHIQLARKHVQPGSHLIKVDLTVGLGDAEDRYCGEFLFRVLPAQHPHGDIHLNIQHGGPQQHEGANQGGINEVAINNVVNLNDPNQARYEALLNQRREPEWVPIELVRNEERPHDPAYTMTLESRNEERPHDPAYTMTLESRTPKWRLPLISSPRFTIGRGTDSDPRADLVVWKLPRSPENDAQTRAISRIHLEAGFDGDVLTIKGANERANCQWHIEDFDKKTTIDLAGVVELKVSLLKSPAATSREWANWTGHAIEGDARTLWHQRPTVGGCLVEWRCDQNHPRRFLCLRTAVELDEDGMPVVLTRKKAVLALLALPHLAIVDRSQNGGDVEPVEAGRLRGNHMLEGDGWRMLAGGLQHHLECDDCRASRADASAARRP